MVRYFCRSNNSSIILPTAMMSILRFVIFFSAVKQRFPFLSFSVCIFFFVCFIGRSTDVMLHISLSFLAHLNILFCILFFLYRTLFLLFPSLVYNILYSIFYFLFPFPVFKFHSHSSSRVKSSHFLLWFCKRETRGQRMNKTQRR